MLALSRALLGWLRARGAKLAVLACNTVSTLIDELAADSGLPLVGIVAPMAAAVAQSGARRVGVLATAFTTASGIYARLINALDPFIEVHAQACPDLARLIEEEGGEEAIAAEIKTGLAALLARVPAEQIVLGCTHYEIHADLFGRLCPYIPFLRPAREQAKAVAELLAQRGLLGAGARGSLAVHTTGDPQACARALVRLGLAANSVQTVQL